MFEININLTASPKLEEALYQLAEVLAGARVEVSKAASVTAESPVPVQPAAPVAASSPAPTSRPAPTAPALAFTLEQISKAGADLITTQPTKMAELHALLAQFNVQSLPELKPEQLGAFATALRGMGADI